LDEETIAERDPAVARHERLRLTAPAVQHEINNAMMILTSNLEMLGRGGGGAPPRRQLDRALAATKRIEETIRGYLDTARRPATEVTTISPAAAVRAVLPLLRVVLGVRYGVELTAPEEERTVRLDRAKLDLALLALARDAVGRMANGARIGLRVENREGEVALALDLPEGAEPTEEVARMLAEAGRLEEGPVLVWGA
jgi:signal transduction histidine kinase